MRIVCQNMKLAPDLRRLCIMVKCLSMLCCGNFEVNVSLSLFFPSMFLRSNEGCAHDYYAIIVFMIHVEY